MTTMTISVPDEKTDELKGYLSEIGGSIQNEKTSQKKMSYKEKIARVGVWTDEDLKPIEEARNHFQGLGSEKW